MMQPTSPTCGRRWLIPQLLYFFGGLSNCRTRTNSYCRKPFTAEAFLSTKETRTVLTPYTNMACEVPESDWQFNSRPRWHLA